MATGNLGLNQRGLALCEKIDARSGELHVHRHSLSCGTAAYDFTDGRLPAGKLLARVCLADLAEVTLIDSLSSDQPWPQVQISTEHPIAACMASQYAGWEIKGKNYFAMGSGPMRAAAGCEPLFDDIGHREQADACIGVLETDARPTDEVCRDLAAKCDVQPSQLTLLFAPTNSLAGTLQVVARSVETSLHKLHELGFDLTRVTGGTGSAPLPPVAEEALAAIGRTNDAILYGAQVTLAVHGDDESIQTIGPRVPSSASAEYGRPFAEILKSYNNDFYQVDPLLFSAAMITLENLDTGNTFQFGELNHEVLAHSFGN